MRIVSIVGARPEFVQAAPISRALLPHHQEILVHTGQHYDYEMSAVFFRQLGLPEPDYNLEVGSGSHAWQTGRILIGVEEVLVKEKPDWVIVRGDTNSTLAGGLAAAKLGYPLAHIEAGLRSFNKHMPEEVNRVLVDRVSDALFCPTDMAVQNLRDEGITVGVYRVGDVMYDGMLYNLALAEKRSTILQDLKLVRGRYLLTTVHRASNTDVRESLSSILTALAELEDLVVFPVHPRTRKQIELFQLDVASNIHLIDPVGYFDILVLQKNARLLLTDSGGMQKEAYCLGTPCITLRKETEWVETVESGWNVLVGAETRSITETVRAFKPPAEHPLLYGDGKAARRIVSLLETL